MAFGVGHDLIAPVEVGDGVAGAGLREHDVPPPAEPLSQRLIDGGAVPFEGARQLLGDIDAVGEVHAGQRACRVQRLVALREQGRRGGRLQRPAGPTTGQPGQHGCLLGRGAALDEARFDLGRGDESEVDAAAA